MAKKDKSKKGKSKKSRESGGVRKMSNRKYEEQLAVLQGELVHLQAWVKAGGARGIVVFEGRDAAGKGGAIKRITERVSPRVFRVVALPAPNEREKSQMYIQRYIRHFPAAGEIVLFDRSWYNRAGVERVMKFCTEEEYHAFMKGVSIFEQWIVGSGIKLIKYWFDIGMEEQERRFRSRIEDPRKTWKLSPMDLASYQRWYDYSRARDAMFDASDTGFAPWHIVKADVKKRARLNCISHLLSQFPYRKIPRETVELGKRKTAGRYDDVASIAGRRFIPDVT